MGELRSGEPALRTPTGDAWDRHVNAFTTLHDAATVAAESYGRNWAARNNETWAGIDNKDVGTNAANVASRVREALMSPHNPNSIFSQGFDSHPVRNTRGGPRVNIGGTWHKMDGGVVDHPSGQIVGLHIGNKWHVANERLAGGSLEGINLPESFGGGQVVGKAARTRRGAPLPQEMTESDRALHEAGQRFDEEMGTTSTSRRGKVVQGKVQGMTQAQWDSLKGIAWAHVDASLKGGGASAKPGDWAKTGYWKKMAHTAVYGMGAYDPNNEAASNPIRGEGGAQPGTGREADLVRAHFRAAAASMTSHITDGSKADLGAPGTDRILSLGRQIWGRPAIFNPRPGEQLSQHPAEAAPGSSAAAIGTFVARVQHWAGLRGVRADEVNGNELRGIAQSMYKAPKGKTPAHPIAPGSVFESAGAGKWGEWDPAQESLENQRIGQSGRQIGSESLQTTPSFRQTSSDLGDQPAEDAPKKRTRSAGAGIGTTVGLNIGEKEAKTAAEDEEEEKKQKEAEAAEDIEAPEEPEEEADPRIAKKAAGKASRTTKRAQTRAAELSISEGYGNSYRSDVLEEAQVQEQIKRGDIAMPGKATYGQRQRALAAFMASTQAKRAAEDEKAMNVAAGQERATMGELIDQEGPTTLASNRRGGAPAATTVAGQTIKGMQRATTGRRTPTVSTPTGNPPGETPREWAARTRQEAIDTGQLSDQFVGRAGLAAITHIPTSMQAPHWTQQASTTAVPQAPFKGKGEVLTKEQVDARVAAGEARRTAEAALPTRREAKAAKRAGYLEGLATPNDALAAIRQHTADVAAGTVRGQTSSEPERNVTTEEGDHEEVTPEHLQALMSQNTPQQTPRAPGGKPSQRTGPTAAPAAPAFVGTVESGYKESTFEEAIAQDAAKRAARSSRAAHFSDGMNSGS